MTEWLESQKNRTRYVILHIRFDVSVFQIFHNLIYISKVQLSELQWNGIGESSLRLPSSGSYEKFVIIVRGVSIGIMLFDYDCSISFFKLLKKSSLWSSHSDKSVYESSSLRRFGALPNPLERNIPESSESTSMLNFVIWVWLKSRSCCIVLSLFW